MFDLITGLTKAAVRTVVATPVALAADVLTLGGVLTDRESYTKEQLRKIAETFEEAVE